MINRITSVSFDDKAKFGKMSVSQMICHCADQFRMMFGEIEGLKRQNVDLAKLIEMTKKRNCPNTRWIGPSCWRGNKIN